MESGFESILHRFGTPKGTLQCTGNGIPKSILKCIQTGSLKAPTAGHQNAFQIGPGNAPKMGSRDTSKWDPRIAPEIGTWGWVFGSGFGVQLGSILGFQFGLCWAAESYSGMGCLRCDTDVGAPVRVRVALVEDCKQQASWTSTDPGGTHQSLLVVTLEHSIALPCACPHHKRVVTADQR